MKITDEAFRLEKQILDRSIQLVADAAVHDVLQKQMDTLTKLWYDEHSRELRLLPINPFRRRIAEKARIQRFPTEVVLSISVACVAKKRYEINLHLVNGALYGFTSRPANLWSVPRDDWELKSVTLATSVFGGQGPIASIRAQFLVPADWVRFVQEHKSDDSCLIPRSDTEMATVLVEGREMTILADASSKVLLTDGRLYYWYALEDEVLGPAVTLSEALETAWKPS